MQQGNVNAWFDGISYSLRGRRYRLIPQAFIPAVFLWKSVYADYAFIVITSIRWPGGPPALRPARGHLLSVQQFNRAHDGGSLRRCTAGVGKRRITGSAGKLFLRRYLPITPAQADEQRRKREPASLLSGSQKYIENSYEEKTSRFPAFRTFFAARSISRTCSRKNTIFHRSISNQDAHQDRCRTTRADELYRVQFQTSSAIRTPINSIYFQAFHGRRPVQAAKRCSGSCSVRAGQRRRSKNRPSPPYPPSSYSSSISSIFSLSAERFRVMRASQSASTARDRLVSLLCLSVG